MADSAMGFDRGIDTAGYSPYTAGDRAQRGSQHGGAQDDPGNELATLIKLGSTRLEAGAEAEATDCFRRALDLGDRTLGPDNPDLVLLLNDLTRLYLRQSAYADAEPLLLRLLDIKRVKGEDHQEVATVLASLAAVRQALGRHESAEQLWRRVLEIRERTLAPNHFAIATALEHLGDACAARGNIREALPAFQRALTIRERTLGASHPSLRVSRERIGDLQLQSAEDPFDLSGDAGIMASPEKYRLVSGEQLRLNAPAAPAREITPPSSREVKAPTAREAIPSAPREMILPISRDINSTVVGKKTRMPAARTEPARAEPAPAPVEAALAAEPTPDPMRAAAVVPDTASYRDALESIQDEFDQPRQPTFIARLSAITQSATELLGKRQVIAGVVVSGVLLLLLAVVKDHAWGELDQHVSPNAVAAREPVQTSPTPTSASALAVPVRESVAPTTVAAKPVASKPHVEERTATKRSEEQPKSDPKKFVLPTISNSIMSHLDSVVSKAGTGSVRGDALSLSVAPTTSGLGTKRANFDASEESSAPQRARLIGELPTPRVPPQVADVEGDVRVRFNVDADGNPVMSTFAVVTSPNPLLTAAVRRVIPSMRFEPARTGGPDGKPIGDVVETGFRFSRLNR